MKAGHAIALTFLTSIFLTGCGCSETDIGGDTGMDPDVHGWDSEPDFDVLNPDVDEFDVPWVEDPSWDPPVDDAGETGWEDTAPWCNPTGVLAQNLDVWSDDSAIYVSMSIPRGPHSQEFIYQNDGTGWIQYSEIGGDGRSMHVSKIVGVPLAGRLFGYGDVLLSNITDSGILWEDFAAADVVVVNDTLAYALKEGSDPGEPPIMRWNGASWGPLPGDPLPYDVRTIWADETSLFCAGYGGLALSQSAGRWTILDTGTTHDFYEMWGFSGTDIWAAAQDMEGGWYVYHYDGSTWESEEPPRIPEEWRNDCNGDGVDEFWGIDGTLFYIGASGFGWWNGTAFEALGFWPDEYGEDGYCTGGQDPTGIWGNAVDEVFLAMRGSSETAPGCGFEYILWWDGTNVHWI